MQQRPGIYGLALPAREAAAIQMQTIGDAGKKSEEEAAKDSGLLRRGGLLHPSFVELLEADAAFASELAAAQSTGLPTNELDAQSRSAKAALVHLALTSKRASEL